MTHQIKYQEKNPRFAKDKLTPFSKEALEKIKNQKSQIKKINKKIKIENQKVAYIKT